MASSNSQRPKKPYVHDKTPFLQKHVVGSENVQISYKELNANFYPAINTAIQVGDYVADISANCSGRCIKIAKHRKKKGLFVTIEKAQKKKK